MHEVESRKKLVHDRFMLFISFSSEFKDGIDTLIILRGLFKLVSMAALNVLFLFIFILTCRILILKTSNN